jgi:UDP-glucose 4-epimerase
MPSEFKHACVTGGAGFIGSHLVEALLRKRVGVTVLDNLSVGRRENVPSGVPIVVGDILDTELVADTLSGCDVVFHLAARVAIRSSFEFAVQDTMTNVVGTASVLRAARNAGSVRKVITASSMAVYGDALDKVPFPETLDTAPISPYGVSKLAAERLTHLMCGEAGMQSTVLRLFNTYGPRQALSPYVGVITIFINRLLSEERPTIFGDGEQCRDFVHVQDVAAAFVGAMDTNVSGEARERSAP